jgi:histidyl-tRNA synthetase
MSVLLEEYTIAADFVSPRESYLIVNEVATLEQSQLLLTMLYAKNKIVEIYPTADKIDKQFRYAEKKGTSHIVQVFDGVAKVKKV